MSSLFGVATGAGQGAGQFLSGYVGSKYGWRVPFVVVALPALFFGCLLAATVAGVYMRACLDCISLIVWLRTRRIARWLYKSLAGLWVGWGLRSVSLRGRNLVIFALDRGG